MELEEIEPTLTEAEKAHAEAARLLKAAEDGRDAKVAELQARLAELEPVRAGVAERVPAALQSKYDRIRKSLGGVGAAALDRKTGLCGACRVKVPVLLAEKVRAGELDTCESCGRLLIYIPEEE